MHLIKLNAIDSTNSFARNLLRQNPKISLTCVFARYQTEGRGQRGTSWQGEPGQNLTFSIVLPKPRVSISNKFLLSAITATTVAQVLQEVGVAGIKVKWPNDIMAGRKKVGGILIETVLSEGRLSAAIIGIGLNVNQTAFEGLPAAASLKTVTGKEFKAEILLEKLLQALEVAYEEVNDLGAEKTMALYKRHLFRLKVPSTFQLPDGRLFTGMISDVQLDGRLVVETEEQTALFDIKEIKLCF